MSLHLRASLVTYVDGPVEAWILDMDCEYEEAIILLATMFRLECFMHISQCHHHQHHHQS